MGAAWPTAAVGGAGVFGEMGWAESGADGLGVVVGATACSSGATVGLAIAGEGGAGAWSSDFGVEFAKSGWVGKSGKSAGLAAAPGFASDLIAVAGEGEMIGWVPGIGATFWGVKGSFGA